MSSGCCSIGFAVQWRTSDCGGNRRQIAGKVRSGAGGALNIRFGFAETQSLFRNDETASLSGWVAYY
ncbi:hypothetical protein KCP69_01455 [Salmonella enterica subsp. enterica]|nr:hypothetical protein KCP69_01455 [Salmonella enterica subsp. enterica]